MYLFYVYDLKSDCKSFRLIFNISFKLRRYIFFYYLVIARDLKKIVHPDRVIRAGVSTHLRQPR